MIKVTETIICDRCMEEITGERVRMAPECTGGNPESVKSWRIMRLLRKDFCRACAEEIIDFALNRDACDECMREMEENALMAADEEGSGSQEEPDPERIDWNAALDRMEQTGLTDGSQC